MTIEIRSTARHAITITRGYLLILACIAPGAMAGSTSTPVHYLLDALEGEYPANLVQDAVGGPRFGFSVAVYGDTLVVGAPDARVHENFERGGAAFIFRRHTQGWTLDQSIPFDFITQTGNDLECGHAVALDALNLLIGCPGNASQAGTVKRYVRPSADAPFELNSVSFNEGTAAGDRCGHSLALLGESDSGTYTVAAVGCPGRNSGQGAVDTWFYCPSTEPCAGMQGEGWHPVGTLNGSVPESFGHDVSLAWYFGFNVMLAVGAPEFGADNDGRAYVYRTNPDLDPWILDETVTGTASGRLGYSLDMATDNSIAYLVSGTPTRTVVPIRGGQVSVGGIGIAIRTAVGWAATEYIQGVWQGGTEDQNRLGHAVAIAAAGANPRFIAGEPDFLVTNRQGRARHYRRDTTTPLNWLLNAGEPFYAQLPPAGTALGTSVDAEGNLAAIGAPGYVDPQAGRRGRVYLYAYGDLIFRDQFE